jgi:hypothetical protein
MRQFERAEKFPVAPRRSVGYLACGTADGPVDVGWTATAETMWVV